MPGPISSEPVVIDGGKSWLSLSWAKPERRGPAPVIAYKVEAWLLGGDGGARWVEVRQKENDIASSTIQYPFINQNIILNLVSWELRQSTHSTHSICDQVENINFA